MSSNIPHHILQEAKHLVEQDHKETFLTPNESNESNESNSFKQSLKLYEEPSLLASSFLTSLSDGSQIVLLPLDSSKFIFQKDELLFQCPLFPSKQNFFQFTFDPSIQWEKHIQSITFYSICNQSSTKEIIEEIPNSALHFMKYMSSSIINADETNRFILPLWFTRYKERHSLSLFETFHKMSYYCSLQFKYMEKLETKQEPTRDPIRDSKVINQGTNINSTRLIQRKIYRKDESYSKQYYTFCEKIKLTACTVIGETCETGETGMKKQSESLSILPKNFGYQLVLQPIRTQRISKILTLTVISSCSESITTFQLSNFVNLLYSKKCSCLIVSIFNKKQQCYVTESVEIIHLQHKQIVLYGGKQSVHYSTNTIALSLGLKKGSHIIIPFCTQVDPISLECDSSIPIEKLGDCTLTIVMKQQIEYSLKDFSFTIWGIFQDEL